MNKLVSIVIPTFNREHTIVRAVESVLRQTYRQLEIIIVDDCSSDNTERVIKDNFASNAQVSYIRLTHNCGACHARNVGVKLSKGEYIAFLDSDDVFELQKIQKQIQLLAETGADLCATDYIRINKRGDEEYIPTFSNEDFFSELLYLNQITTGTLLGHRHCFEDIPFDESLPRYQDWDLNLRLAKKYRFCFLKEKTLIQYYQPVSISSSTSHHKTYCALVKIFEKNRNDYMSSPKGYSQIMWLVGLHSLYTKEDRNVSALWKGVVVGGFKIHRCLIFIMVLLGNRSIVDNNL